MLRRADMKKEYLSPEVELIELDEILTTKTSGDLDDDELGYAPIDW